MKKKHALRMAFWTMLVVISLVFAGCGDDGDDGARGATGPAGPTGPAGSSLIDASTASNETLAGLDVESEITSVSIASAPVVNFTVSTADGVPIVGIGDLWEDSNRFVRFTLTKLVAGEGSNPDTWVAYTRETTGDGSTPPDYDTGSSLVDHGDGSYTFTFNTDVENVSGVSYQPSLTHRVAGQIGSGSVELEPQNPIFDFVPSTGAETLGKRVAVMDSCNECHDGLVFHGRRFKVEYCVNCHNPDLAAGEGEMAFMIHKIHAAGDFAVLDNAISYAEVTYPQDLTNCRKCHNGSDDATPQGNNWQTVQYGSTCFDSCHGVPSDIQFVSRHTADEMACADCHDGSLDIDAIHITLNATPNNPNLPDGVPEIAYNLNSVTVDGSGFPTVTFTITADGTPLDMNNLPDGFVDAANDPFRTPRFIMGWALPQGPVSEPNDFNNRGEDQAEPVTVEMTDLIDNVAGTIDCTGGTCVATFTSDAFPAGATMRSIGIERYFRFDVDGDESFDYNLHAPSVVKAAEGDEARRVVVDNDKCANCHEWLELHGGTRTFETGICVFCHNPNRSSSGRAINPTDAVGSDAAADLENTDTWTWPEDSQNLKDMVHGIHASAFRSRDFEHVRNRNDGIYYNWSEVTFPAENGTRNCLLCHMDGTYEVPLRDDLLPTTVRTTGTSDGLDGNDYNSVIAARASVPNETDWVNSPTASSCFYCHTTDLAAAHMEQNGAFLSFPAVDDAWFTQRQTYNSAMNAEGFEACAVCHGDGKSADLNVVHELE